MPSLPTDVTTMAMYLEQSSHQGPPSINIFGYPERLSLSYVWTAQESLAAAFTRRKDTLDATLPCLSSAGRFAADTLFGPALPINGHGKTTCHVTREDFHQEPTALVVPTIPGASLRLHGNAFLTR